MASSLKKPARCGQEASSQRPIRATKRPLFENKKGLVKAQQIANQIALAQAAAKHQLKKIFTFHSRKSSAKSFTSERGEGIGTHLPNFAALPVNGAMSTAARDGLMTAPVLASRRASAPGHVQRSALHGAD